MKVAISHHGYYKEGLLVGTKLFDSSMYIILWYKLNQGSNFEFFRADIVQLSETQRRITRAGKENFVSFFRQYSIIHYGIMKH